MAKSKKKLDSKTFARQKRTRRQWITFIRMCRYGINNFTRNAWLTIAATAVMTITLFVVFTSVVSRTVLMDTLSNLRDTLQMTVYLKTDTSEEDAGTVKSEIEDLPSVLEVTVITPSEARENFAQQNKDSEDALNALKQATNQLPWTLNVKVRDINDTTELADYVENSDLVQSKLDPRYPPSFAGTKRATIESIANAAGFAQQIGVIVSSVFVIVSTLIIFNTIRMAIFNRREEINMMKLIGAEKSFIRGPFIVEAIVYGFFAAVIASVIGYGLLFLAAPSLSNYFNIQPTLDLLQLYAGFVLLGMIMIGAIIGIISSLMATRRHLKL
jgi:cell division transport system permease protein